VLRVAGFFVGVFVAILHLHHCHSRRWLAGCQRCFPRVRSAEVGLAGCGNP